MTDDSDLRAAAPEQSPVETFMSEIEAADAAEQDADTVADLAAEMTADLAAESAETPAHIAPDMAAVDVVINGQEYRLACEPGQEAHVGALAAMIAGHIDALAVSGLDLGALSEARVMLMAALLLADEITDLEQKLALAESRAETAERAAEESDEDDRALEEAMSKMLVQAATRLETLAARFEAR